MERFKVGIIGAGHIARKMAHTLRDMEGVEPYAVASRNQENAEGFACEWGFTRAYGSYEDLADDPEVQLIYIATPHSHHFEQARMCLEKGKPVLCEKAFTANAEQAETLIRLSKEKQVFLTEAIWTRYMPFSETLRELVDGGTIGRVMMLTANIGYPIAEKERIGTLWRCFAGYRRLSDQLCKDAFRLGNYGDYFCLRERGDGSGFAEQHYFCVSESSDGCFTNDRFLCERSPGSYFGG